MWAIFCDVFAPMNEENIDIGSDKMILFADRLKELRKDTSLTQKELAEQLNISKSTIAMYETNQRQPDIDSLIIISDLFNVSIDYLVGKSEMRNYESLSDNIIELIEISKNLSNDQVENVLNLIKGFIQKYYIIESEVYLCLRKF